MDDNLYKQADTVAEDLLKLDPKSVKTEMDEFAKAFAEFSELMTMFEKSDDKKSGPRPMSKTKIKAAKLRKKKRKRGGPR